MRNLRRVPFLDRVDPMLKKLRSGLGLRMQGGRGLLPSRSARHEIDPVHLKAVANARYRDQVGGLTLLTAGGMLLAGCQLRYKEWRNGRRGRS